MCATCPVPWGQELLEGGGRTQCLLFQMKRTSLLEAPVGPKAHGEGKGPGTVEVAAFSAFMVEKIQLRKCLVQPSNHRLVGLAELVSPFH